jgi:predicted amidohydrolase YtcJ
VLPPTLPSNSGFLRARQVLTLAPGVSGDSVWWQGGSIRAVGWARDLEHRVPTRVPRYDLPDSLVTPGFVDGHTHFALWALSRRRVRLAGVATRVEALRRIAGGSPEGGWLVGHGWDASQWEDPPDRWSLDAVVKGPAVFQSLDLHAAWANSAALAAAGIDRDTPDPAGGRIARDALGEPTGILLERAAWLVTSLSPPPRSTDLIGALRDAQAEAHRVGLTGIHDPEDLSALRGFRALEGDGSLRLRVLFHPPVAQLPTLLAQGVRSGQGGEWLALGGVKLFLDGSLGSRTAWMLEPYEDGGDCGLPLAGEAEARQAVRLASEGGIACCIHAIGDAAVRRALSLLEPVPAGAVPHRIEHCQCIHPADLSRAAAAGIIASMQPAHLPGDVALAEERWGRRGSGTYALRSLLRCGTTLAFGSDMPVADPDPRLGVAAAVGRVAADGSFPGGWYPAQRIAFEEAVRGYTLGNALAAGQADHRGRLAPGYDADLVAWDVDPAVGEGDPAAFAHAGVALTVVAGEPVFLR